MLAKDTRTYENIYPLTKKTAIRRIFTASESAFLDTYKFYDVSKRELFTVTYLYDKVSTLEYVRLYTANNRSLLSVRKDTLKKVIAHIAREIRYNADELANDLYKSLQDRGLYSVARVYHKKIFEKR